MKVENTSSKLMGLKAFFLNPTEESRHLRGKGENTFPPYLSIDYSVKTTKVLQEQLPANLAKYAFILQSG